jgi:hypothetical protein
MSDSRSRARWAGRTVLAWLLGILSAASVNGAGEGPQAAKDHPLFPRMPGYAVLEHATKDAGHARFCRSAGQSRVTVTGRYWHWHFSRRPQPRPGGSPASEAGIRRHYRDALTRAKALWICDAPSDVDGLVVQGGKELWLHVRAFTPGTTYQVEIIERDAQ